MSAPSAVEALSSIRSLILHALLALLLLLSGAGLAMLLSAGFDAVMGTEIYPTDLAIALSLSLVSIPLAWVLWRSIRRRMSGEDIAQQQIHAIASAGVYLISLIVSTLAALTLVGLLLDPTLKLRWGGLLGTALGWGAVCWWQYRTVRNAPHSLAAPAGYAYAVIIAGGSWAALLSASLTLLLTPDATLLGPGALPRLAGSVLWTLGACALWFWHWKLQRVQDRVDAFSTVLVLATGICLPAVTALLSGAATINALLQTFSSPGPVIETFVQAASAPVGLLLAGTTLWLYHLSHLAGYSAQLVGITRQVISGAAVAMAATGLGLIINALLASLAALDGGVGAGALRAGLSLLIVGAPFWVWFFQPHRPKEAAKLRIYLVLFFGVSAVVALIALLVVAFRLLSVLLGSDIQAQNLIDYLRAPLGLLVATGAVAAYHFTLWRSGRTAAVVVRPQRRVVLVAPNGSQRLIHALQSSAEVQVQWIASDGPRLEDAFCDHAMGRISEVLATGTGPLLAVVAADGTVQFTGLA